MSGVVPAAVFISYASQDAEAAKRICEALRAAGVEVWFDQSELRGGDAWDQKIRRQIKECALFVPIVSANTEARAEGYFRLEWKLADRRTDLIGKSKAFLLPVCIDDTPDADADVPDSFLAVQWVRLRGGETPAAFCERVRVLVNGTLDGAIRGPSLALRPPNPPGLPAVVTPTAAGRVPAKAHRRMLGLAVAGSLILAVVGIWRPWEIRTPSAMEAPHPTGATRQTALATEAQRVARQAYEVLLQNGLELGPNDLDAAAVLCERATTLDPSEAEAWAAWSEIESYRVIFAQDGSPERQESARAKAARALHLAPDGFEARRAQACYLVGVAGMPAAREAEVTLRTLRRERPRDWQTLLSLGMLLRDIDKFDEALECNRQLAALPGGAARGYNDMGYALHFRYRWSDSNEAIDQSLAARAYTGNVSLKVTLALQWMGDLDVALTTLKKLPPSALLGDRSLYAAIRVYRWRQEPEQTLAVLNVVPRDWITWNFDGPKGVFAGDAHELAGRARAARNEWKAALALVEQKLTKSPNHSNLNFWKAYLLAALGDRVGAQAALKLATETSGGADWIFDACLSGGLVPRLFSPEEITAALEMRAFATPARVTLADLRLNPALSDVRGLPRFQALIKRMEADPRYSPTPLQSADSGRLTNSKPETHDAKSMDFANAKSIAVLPFANLSPDPENAFFADGVHEDVITNLAKIRDLKVISRTSTLAYRDPAQRNLRKIAEELGVAAVLEGSVRRAGGKVRVSAKLIDARTDQPLWGETYNEELSDIFAVQAKLAQEIATALRATLTPAERSQIAQRPTQNQQAYDLYLRARATREDVSRGMTFEKTVGRAIELLDEAVALDPEFALAYVELARAHSKLYWYAAADPTPERLAKMVAVVEAAQRIAPGTPEARIAAGYYHYYGRMDFTSALADFQTAEATRPNDADVHYMIGTTQRRLGRWHEALASIERAVELNPREVEFALNYAGTLRLLRRYPQLQAAQTGPLRLLPNRITDEFQGQRPLDQFEIDGDLAAAVERIRNAAPVVLDTDGRTKAYCLALLTRDYEAAERALAGAKSTGVNLGAGNLVLPIPLLQANVAYLRGNQEAARRHAEIALAALRGEKLSRRQEPWAKLAAAQAHAFAGRAGEAVRVGREALAEIEIVDPHFGVALARDTLGQIYAALDLREEALAELRRLMTGPSVRGPNATRIDPLWSRLKDDPRFEQILKSAKPL